MKIKSTTTRNTGGNCMVTYVGVTACGGTTMIEMNGEVMVGCSNVIDCNTESYTELWVARDMKELEEYLSEEDIGQLMPIIVTHCIENDETLSFGTDGRWSRYYSLEKINVDLTMEEDHELLNFVRHCDAVADRIMDTQDYSEQHTFTLTLDGKSVSIPNNADLYDHLMSAIISYLKNE